MTSDTIVAHSDPGEQIYPMPSDQMHIDKPWEGGGRNGRPQFGWQFI